jgi:hypothetical protein
MRPACVVVLLTAVWCVAASARQATPPQSRQEAGLLAAFNDCLQERFRDVDQAFGIRRIIRLGETPHRFAPENARELGAVRDLERGGLHVVLYLTGRQVLQPKPASTSSEGVRPAIRGPVMVTASNRSMAPAPSAADLWDESRRALTAFARVDSHGFARDGWQFTARPVRATESVCLNCHAADGTTSYWSPPAPGSRLRVGEVLGVVLYGVRRVD